MRNILKTRQKLAWSGMAFSLVALSVFMAAVNTGTNLLYLVAGGLLSFLVLSLLLSRWSLSRLRVIREAPATVYRNEEFAVGVRVENPKMIMSAFSVRLESAARPQVSAGYLLKVPRRSAALTRMLEAMPSRGLHALPAVVAVTAFPFGLIEARRRMSDSVDVLVYPRVHPVRTSVIEQLLGAGQVVRTATANGDEFFSLREYVRGDDVRRIAWRPSARLGTLVVREMESDAARTVTLFLDTARTDHPAFNEHFEAAVEAAASLSVALLKSRFSVCLATPKTFVAEAEGASQARRLLDALARVEPSDDSGALGPSTMPAGRRQESANVILTGDVARWGSVNRSFGARVLDPREIIGE